MIRNALPDPSKPSGTCCSPVFVGEDYGNPDQLYYDFEGQGGSVPALTALALLAVGLAGLGLQKRRLKV